MRKRIIHTFVLFLFMFSNTAFATNWVYVTTNSLYGITSKYYVDADSVIKNNGTITYWWMVENEKTDPALGVKRYIEKIEARPKDPRGTRTLESHNYGAKGEYIFGFPSSDSTRNSKFNAFIPKGSPRDMAIDAALKYAREGKDDGQKPTLP